MKKGAVKKKAKVESVLVLKNICNNFKKNHSGYNENK